MTVSSVAIRSHGCSLVHLVTADCISSCVIDHLLQRPPPLLRPVTELGLGREPPPLLCGDPPHVSQGWFDVFCPRDGLDPLASRQKLLARVPPARGVDHEWQAVSQGLEGGDPEGLLWPRDEERPAVG